MAKAPAYDLIAQAMSGIMSITGPEGGAPVSVGVAIGDMVPALYATISVLAALRQRELDGRGQHIDIAMFDSLVSFLEQTAMRAFLTDEEIVPTGTDHPSSAPFGAFATKDDPIVIAIANDALFARFADALGHPEWVKDPRFETDAARGKHRHLIRQLIEAELQATTRDRAIESLTAAGIPCGPILGVREVVKHPNVRERDLVLVEPDGFQGLAIPFKLHDGRRAASPAPVLGQHTSIVDAILEKAGIRQHVKNA